MKMLDRLILLLTFWSFRMTSADVMPKFGTLRDRYVIGEHGSIELSCCAQPLENVRWEFVSPSSNTIEILYDGVKSMMPGFKIYMKHDKCILKLVRARSKDSGTYTCMVREAEFTETNASSATYRFRAVAEIRLVVKTPMRKTMLVGVGDSVVLPCEHNITNLTRALWDHFPIRGNDVKPLYHMTLDKIAGNDSNYLVSCRPHQLSCNLKIVRANRKSAGRYVCMIGDSLEYEKKYGMDEITVFVEIELVIGDLTCNEDSSNKVNSTILLGENDCYGIKPDTLFLNCTFEYFGTIEMDHLRLRWVVRSEDTEEKGEALESLVLHRDFDEGGRAVSALRNVTANLEMVNLEYSCFLGGIEGMSCRLSEFKIQYVKNTTEKPRSGYFVVPSSPELSADKSDDVNCSYYVIHDIGQPMQEHRFRSLSAASVNPLSVYTWIAECYLVGGRTCHAKVLQIEVVKMHVIIYATLATIALIGILAGLLGKFIKCGSRRNNVKERAPNQENEQKALLGQELKLIDEKNLPGCYKSFAISRDEIYFCDSENLRIEVYSFENLDWKKSYICQGLLTEICDILEVSDCLFVSGKEHARDHIVAKVLRIGLMENEGPVEIYAHKPFDRGTCRLSRSCPGNGVVFITMHDRIVHLSDTGIVRGQHILASMYDAIQLCRGKYAVCRSNNLEIIYYDDLTGVELQCHSYNSLNESERIDLPRCMAKDSKWNLYVGDDALSKIYAIDRELKFLAYYNISFSLEKIVFDEERSCLYCLVDKNRLMYFKLQGISNGE